MRISIDDFGTGYSSLSYLTRSPIDTIRIHQLFVRRITSVPSETRIVTAVIGMARGLALRAVAKGVETEEELMFLRSLGCDEAQGYLFSHPLPAAALASLMRNRLAPGLPATTNRFAEMQVA